MPSPTAPAATELEAALAAHRRELTGFCYRMLGASSEAEDAVQETSLRAWKAYDRFEGRASLRSWLFRIATNVCIDMQRSPQRRARPMDLGPARPALGTLPGPELVDQTFVQPVRDGSVLDLGADPSVVAEARETIRLAFVAALQLLPARQRAVLILCEVLRWSAAETAELLETTAASVNSALQRARATLAERDDVALDRRLDPAHEALLDRYVDAFERYDLQELATLLREDVALSMPPHQLWLQGVDDVIHWMANQGAGCGGSRLVPIDLNGTAGFACYRPAGPGHWVPFALQVIEVAGGRIVGHHNFLYPGRFTDYGLAPSLES